MTTKRKKTKSIARRGINYARTIVESNNCIFQEIDLDNDVGNDAYIEFVDHEAATGCCIAVQIKSGESYFTRQRENTLLRSDKNHFEYWNAHLLPVAAIVYNPQTNVAVWCDVTEFLASHPERITKGPYTIPISSTQEFTDQGFSEFFAHFYAYRERYSREERLGMTLEQFSDLQNAEACLDGIHSLFSYHRHRIATWYYLINCFRNFADHPALKDLIIALTHLPGHGDIFWHRDNIIDDSTRRLARTIMASRFGREEALLLLSTIDETGIERGSMGQCVHAIVDVIRHKEDVLYAIAFDRSVPDESRYWALILLLYDLQDKSVKQCITLIERYIRTFPDDFGVDMLTELVHDIALHGGFSLY